MDLGVYANYPLPTSISTAFGAQTAQELADQWGAQGTLTPALAREAEASYVAYRSGNTGPARAFLKDRLALSDSTIDDALTKLRAL